MNEEMEIPKILWLKNQMPIELFNRCKFYDLVDALTFLATDNKLRSFDKDVCSVGHVAVGVDGTVKGWQRTATNLLALETSPKIISRG